MFNRSKICLFLCCFPLCLFGQEDTSLEWIKELAREVKEETDLCERCNWIPPAISEIENNGRIFYFLRYGCSTTESVARMYSPDGTFLGECKSNDDDLECNPSDVDAFITYTFATRITILWSCETDFDCAFALANNIDREVPIFVNDDRCTEGIKTLEVSDNFMAYEWSGEGEFGTTRTLEVTKAGRYEVTVTDEMGCTFSGNIDIPDTRKVDVKIKGPSTICPETSADLLVFGFDSYEWSTGETDSLITISAAGNYQITVTNDQNCEGISTFVLQNFDPLELTINADKSTVPEGNPVNVAVSTPSEEASVADYEYEWMTNGEIDCRTCPEINYFPQLNNELYVLVTDENDCINRADFVINVTELPSEIYAPNIFSPASISGNNQFTIYGGTNAKTIESFSIFDRWGNLVFFKTNLLPSQPNEGWDGRINGVLAKQDTYLYQAIILFANGERKIMSGDVFLLR